MSIDITDLQDKIVDLHHHADALLQMMIAADNSASYLLESIVEKISALDEKLGKTCNGNCGDRCTCQPPMESIVIVPGKAFPFTNDELAEMAACEALKAVKS